jgi:hypothetical protein
VWSQGWRGEPAAFGWEGRDTSPMGCQEDKKGLTSRVGSPGASAILAVMHRLLPLLFLACASSRPAEYERGTYRPAPPVFNPVQDAPHTTGQPGHLLQSKEYPRSPHKRPLPPSEEPGLWAGDGPIGSASPTAQPTLLGVPLPFHKGGADDRQGEPSRAGFVEGL